MEKVPMTPKGMTALQAELKQLKSVERPAIIRAIAEAREHGDLSENAEYHSAREKQSFIEGRVKELEGLISLAEGVIDPAKLSGAIKFGATVTLVDEETEAEKTYQIVGEQEADIENGLLNIRSPLARALIGKEEGDSVEVRTPGGDPRLRDHAGRLPLGDLHARSRRHPRGGAGRVGRPGLHPRDGVGRPRRLVPADARAGAW